MSYVSLFDRLTIRDLVMYFLILIPEVRGMICFLMIIIPR